MTIPNFRTMSVLRPLGSGHLHHRGPLPNGRGTALSLAVIIALCVSHIARTNDSDRNAAAQETPAKQAAPATVDSPPKTDAPKTIPEPPRPDEESPAPRGTTLGDPTAPGEDLRNVLQQMKSNKPTGAAVRPALPIITLRGRVFATEEDGVALLDIDKQLVRIRTGQELRLTVGGSALTIQAEEVSTRAVRLLIAPLNLRMEF